MRRRLTVTIVSVVAVALLVAGLGSLLLVRRATAQQTRAEVLSQAKAIAVRVDTAQRPSVVGLLVQIGRLYSTGIVAVGDTGALASGTKLPSGVTRADLHPDQLLAGQDVSGVEGSLAYAAVPVHLSAQDLAQARRSGTAAGRAVARAQLAGLTLAEVATRQVPGPAGGAAWFAVAGALALVVAAAVAEGLGLRISRPLRHVEAAARRIAGGDLASRIEVSPRDYPELASLSRSINTMTEALQRAQGLERQFLMSVSHDLRTPLTSIRGWAEAISDGAAEGPRAARIIGAETARLERLVGDLLDLARIDARSFSTHPRPVALGPLVAERADAFRPGVEEASLRLEVDTPDEGPTAVVDPDRLGQVVANLLENAYKYARSRIVVRVTSEGSRAVIWVEDDGPGIPPDDLAHVFDRLYQVEPSPARQAGSGLGLTIVKELTQAMGGQVALESPTGPSGGSRIRVTLPLMRPDASSYL